MPTNPPEFSLAPNDITLWLNSLDKLNSAKSAVELNNKIKTLRKFESNPTGVLEALIQFAPKVLEICNAIERTFSSKNLSKAPRLKAIKLCIQLLKNMGQGFYKINQLDSTSEKEKNHAQYFALQFIGYNQRLCTLFHVPPPSSLWTEIGQIYNSALKTDSYQLKIKHAIPIFNAQPSIESVVKRNLLFNLCAPHKYSDNQIKELFLLANKIANKLFLNNSQASSLDSFQWNPTSNDYPCMINNITQDLRSATFINTENLLEYIQSNDYICNLEHETLQNTITLLSGYQSLINNPIPSAPTISHLLIGFNDIGEYLTKVNTLKKIQQLSAQPSEANSLHHASVESMDSSSNQQIPKNFSASNLKFLTKSKTVKTLQVNSSKHIIAETSYIECNIGDVVLFCYPDLTNKTGIIRQVKVTNESKTVHILIEEVIGSTSGYQYRDSLHIEESILISITNPDSHLVILPSQHQGIRSFETIKSVTGELFTLKELIDFSPFFSLYRVT